jgi:hypothetical protein
MMTSTLTILSFRIEKDSGVLDLKDRLNLSRVQIQSLGTQKSGPSLK